MKTPAFYLLLLLLLVPNLTLGRNQYVNIHTSVSMSQAIEDVIAAAKYNENWTVMMAGGKSMTPYFGDCSILLVSQTSYQRLKPGMIVVFRDNENDLVGHWLVRKTPNGWITKGANNKVEDPALMTAKDYQGVVFGVLNTVGKDASGLALAQELSIPEVLGKSR